MKPIKNEFAHPSLRHCTVLNKFPENKTPIRDLTELRQKVVNRWDTIAAKAIKLFDENKISYNLKDLQRAPEERAYEGCAVMFPDIPIQVQGFDTQFSSMLVLCLPPIHPKIWSKYSLVSHKKEAAGLGSRDVRKFFDCCVLLSQDISDLFIPHYNGAMKEEHIATKTKVVHSFDIRTVAVDREDTRLELNDLSSGRSGYIDDVLRIPSKFRIIRECFRYLPKEIAITKKRDNWFGLTTYLGKEMVNFLYNRTSVNGGKESTNINGICYDFNYEENGSFAPAIGSGLLVRALSLNI